ncbi:MAG: Phosphoglycerate mutase (2,3-diphosphoglycerate-independent), archaeal type [Candidatus Fermentimicrarchaeum limneticum]|uniref:2,3-bisphosphoglycerate-independent phosphoglycerate mutase n=1 Tax=Fermentimicrarchaeum limneticum TaxID=2795018 RepID=A0A7D5XLJ5_FERL1|nr:MAG: Phosphoglycerate mutase (2,3-diphosphoglycerate-independent), archaeal type [Candidatus Fermentimicrarchaeum limneticum]
MGGKAILMICDGLGDRQFKGRTPLQRARRPNMNMLASKGITGLMDTISPGVTPGSDTAHLALFSYDPHTCYQGRGVYEALGAGLELEEGDVAFRCNFATVDSRMVVRDRRAGRITGVGEVLAKELNGQKVDSCGIVFKATTEHRGVLVLRGEGLSRNVSDVDPHEANMPVLKSKPLDGTMESKRTAFILNRFTEMSHEILAEHPINVEREKKGKPPANIVLSRGAGAYARLDTLEERYGIKSACVAGGALYKGVARAVRMDVIDVEGATATANTNLVAKASAVKKALEDHDVVFLHIKATDNFSHDGDINGKVKMIERIDKILPLLMKTGAYIILSGDHSTPCTTKNHSADPLPIVIYGEGVRVDDVKRFDEISCMKGGLGHIRGLDVMPIMLSLIGKTKIFGS